MAWLDDRYWAHSKVTGLSDKAFRVSVSAILYSHGFGLYGRLTLGHQKAVGSRPKIRTELVEAGLWDEDGDDILIHDWDEHNGKRDKAIEDRRRQDRERKRAQREAAKEAERVRATALASLESARKSAGSPHGRLAEVREMSSRERAGAGAG